MMQMSDTHPERDACACASRGVPRARFSSPQSQTRAHCRAVPRGHGAPSLRTTARQRRRRTALGRHACVCMLHVACCVRVWARHGHGSLCTLQTLLAGSIPIVRHTALHPLHARLPVLVADWSDDPSVRAFWANYMLRREAYDYERLFADHWFAWCATRALPRAPSCSHETTHRERQRWRRRRRRRRRRAKLAASEDGDGVANPGGRGRPHETMPHRSNAGPSRKDRRRSEALALTR